MNPYSKVIKNIKMKYSTIFVLLFLNIQIIIAFILDHDTCLVLERVLKHEDKANQYSVTLILEIHQIWLNVKKNNFLG